MKPLLFEKKFHYGEISGVIYYNQNDISKWLDSQGDYEESENILNQIEDIDYPIAVLDKIYINDQYKNMKYGKALYNMFEKFSKDNECDATMLISDSFEKQTEGFDLDIWYINLGYNIIGDLNSNNVMIKNLN